MAHIVMNGVRHPIYHLGNPDKYYLTSITKIQGSSLLVCTDSIKKSVYLFDIYRAYNPLTGESYGYHLNDLAVSSALLIDEFDGDAVCGDICVDLSGHNLYALILRRSGGAWIKIYEIIQRKIYFTGVRYAVPYSTEYHMTEYSEESPVVFTRDDLIPYDDTKIVDIRTYNETGRVVFFSSKNVCGVPYLYNNLCYGSGLEIMNGRLYILTRRRIPYAVWTWLTSNWVRVDTTTLEVSMLSVVAPHNGEPISHFLLSKPSVEGDEEGDCVLHGLTKVDGQLVSQVRYDHNVLRAKPNQWSLGKIRNRGQTALVQFDDPIETGATKMSVLPLTTWHCRFPYGVALAYSITADQSDRKLYGVFGNQVWDFEIMDYTFIVRYPKYDENGNLVGYDFFEGDIIDLGDIVKDDTRTEIQCFLRNDSSHDMIDVEITLELDGIDRRQDDIFISLTPTSFGYKHLNLGTIVPGGSKEFWFETHPMNVGQVEMNRTHKLPLRVAYKVDYDDIW